MCKQPLNVAAWRGANLNYLLWDSVIYNNHIWNNMYPVVKKYNISIWNALNGECKY